MASLPPDAPRPRLCLIRKRTPEEEYGFNLHAEKSKGQFIGAVDAGSPAEVAGLLPGDRIISVNGVPVINEPHKQVVNKIKENALCCDLIVVDEETQNWYNENKRPVPTDPNLAEIATGKSTKKEHVQETVAAPPDTPPMSSDRIHVQDYSIQVQEYSTSTPPAPRPPSYQEALAADSPQSQPRARLCKLIKPDPSAEFGFNLHAEKNTGHFIGKIDPNSIAELAGLEEGQRIVGVNGVLIYPHTPHKDVVSLIKGNPMRTELLVASTEVDLWHKKNAQEFEFATAEHFVPMEPVEQGIISRGVAQLNMNGYKTNGDSGYSNGDRDRDEVLPQKETKRGNTDSPIMAQGDRYAADFEEHSPSSYSRSKPPPPVEPYESIRDTAPSHQPHSQQPDWMKLSAAQMRERVGQNKKPDPRKEQLSLQQKHELIRNM